MAEPPDDNDRVLVSLRRYDAEWLAADPLDVEEIADACRSALAERIVDGAR
jgi:hypothetical protein